MKNIYKVIIIVAIIAAAFEGYLYYLKTQALTNTLNPVRFVTYKVYERELRPIFIEEFNLTPKDDLVIAVTDFEKSYGVVKARMLVGINCNKDATTQEEMDENVGCSGLELAHKQNGTWKIDEWSDF